MTSYVLPGQPIPLASQWPSASAGRRAYIASLVGIPQQEGPVLSISRVRPRPPAINSVVLGSVTRLSPLQATLSISVVDGVPLPAGEEFTGVIRIAGHRVKIGDSISLGDARSYFVTTARNDLGVVFAVSEAGKTMVPVSWQSMRCPETGRLEKRKCAKPE
ncbi:hypothetical protein C8F04DRAFT_1089432 [Mycena alexandri]|uniref:Exosome complex component CSL4 C-terminal domain-containing protein n=1 Tax=Mycena alexandri TaxID=1745969 RepID=A0AAD6T1G3_9AGAR|nr:hypothetical protein C8F04DRAFT_1089432 [Mycena alexandri]